MEILLKLDDYWEAHNPRLNEDLFHHNSSCENLYNTRGVRLVPPKDCKQELYANYASARIILSSLLASASQNREIQQMYEEHALRYSARVLSEISLDSHRLDAMTGRFLMGFSFRVISEYSPCSEQRQAARDALVRWELVKHEAVNQNSVILA